MNKSHPIAFNNHTNCRLVCPVPYNTIVTFTKGNSKSVNTTDRLQLTQSVKAINEIKITNYLLYILWLTWCTANLFIVSCC